MINRITQERFVDLSKQIKAIFPTELIETWYTALTRGTDGGKICPRGKLYNAYNEKRRILNDINFIN